MFDILAHFLHFFELFVNRLSKLIIFVAIVCFGVVLQKFKGFVAAEGDAGLCNYDIFIFDGGDLGGLES